MNTKPARGMRDFLPNDVRKRRYVMGVIAEVYESYGFEPLETPAAENIETLLGKYGEEGDRLIFKILKRGEEATTGQADLALRYDLTVPLARVVAEHRAELPRLFKRFQIQPVWRADRPQKGRYREFYQCDVDAIGSESPLVEVELCAAASDVLHKLGFTEFDIVINHREILNALLRHAGVPTEKYSDVLTTLDKTTKIGGDGVFRELGEKGIEIAARTRVCNWLEARWGTDWASWVLEQIPTYDSVGRDAADNLRQIFELAGTTSAAPHLKFEPTLARGLSYYTGAIFEIQVHDLAGSLGGGGRYDNLIGMFSGQRVPAAGFSLGLERILVVMTQREMFRESVPATPADVMVTIRSPETTSVSLQVAAELREQKLRVELYPGVDKLGKQLQYASLRKIRYAIILNEEVSVKREVTVRNVVTGNQEVVTGAAVDIASYILRRALQSGEPSWRIVAPSASLSENVDDSALSLQLGVAVNAIGAAQRFYMAVADSRGPAGERDRLWAFLVAVGFIHEALHTVYAPNAARIQELARLGGVADSVVSDVKQLISPHDKFRRAIHRLRNKMIFHWDQTELRRYVTRFEGGEVAWAEGSGVTQGETVCSVAANALTNSILPDDEPNASAARNLQRMREFTGDIPPAMKSLMTLFQHAIMGHFGRYTPRHESD